MNNLGEMKLLETLLLLLPGFVTAEIIGVLVLREERKALDRIIQALIYTFLAHLLWTPLSKLFPENPAMNLLGLGASAVGWGLVFTWTINSGTVHRLLRWVRLTRAGSRPNEWYDAFYDKQQHVVLHLKDGRRIFGWPLLYPFRPDKGHVLLEGAEWLDRQDTAACVQRGDYLIDVSDVRFVEFVPPKELEKRDD